MSEQQDRAELPPDGITAVFRRLKEHRIAQWTVGYVAIAYGIQHAVTLTSEALDWAHVVTRISIILLALGLPVAMTLAWYHGEKASRRISGPELSIISLLLVTSSLLFAVLVHPAGITTPRAVEAGVTAARVAAASPKGGVSVAVLPFVNLSSDKEQEFFSDGMTEEITAALAKVPDMGVVARTSAFEFKGKNIEIEKIGQQLHATHLIEGSVRKAGNRLRITAQLIKADDGTHIWAEDYDRELTDVFAIQEDIARSIATSLHMTLSLKPGDSLVSNRLNDPHAHELYLRALAAFRNRGGGDTGPMALATQLVSEAPDFAPGWALQAMVQGRSRVNAVNPVNLSKDAEISARKAIALDPNLALSYGALAVALTQQRKNAEALASIKQAYALDPDNPEILDDYRNYLAIFGYLKQALDISERLSAIEPQVPLYARFTGMVRIANRHTDSGISALNAGYRMLFAGNRAGGFRFSVYLAAAYAQQGQLNKAAEILLADPSRLERGPFRRSMFEVAARILQSAAKREQAPAPLPDFDSELNFAYIHAGTPERMLDWPENAAKRGDRTGIFDVWWPMPSSVRKTARFRKLMRDAGLVEFWRKNGWPDLCHPTTGDDFECS
ncbi:MAG TPA: hypothetical protein VFW28_09940 [Micropepsaceae bacterium]|nr:hypothetical protein [Micropepsaceae bacterium]